MKGERRGRKRINDKTLAQIKIDCFVCEGVGSHFGGDCACNGSGKEKLRRALQRVYNLENDFDKSYNINQY